jgi:hypothetical protein
MVGVQWRMLGPVAEAFEALGLSEQGAPADSWVAWLGPVAVGLLILFGEILWAKRKLRREDEGLNA